jgi:hypothetical protein
MPKVTAEATANARPKRKVLLVVLMDIPPPV